MHAEARAFVDRLLMAELPRINARTVLDVGGRDVNGSVRDLFPARAVYDVLDVEPGENVTIVADATEWEPPTPESYDVVLSTETFEHVEKWPRIVVRMGQALRPGGCMIVTAACDPREPHSGVDGWDLRPGEWYENVDPENLALVMERVLRGDVRVKRHPRGDVYAYGFKL